MSKKRKDIGSKLRFEVFKRDSFTCQYCGGKAPDIILNIDHIEPISKGGTNDITNLITSCFKCNSGKGDRRISDDTVVEKKRKQLEYLQERRAQIEMMLEWQKGVDDNEMYLVNEVAKFWSSKVKGFYLNERGKKELSKLLKKYSVEDVFGAIRDATSSYLKYIDGEPTSESVEESWKRIGGILKVKNNPELSRLYYIRGILRNRCDYCDDKKAIILLREFVSVGGDIDSLEEFTKEVDTWSTWKYELEVCIEQLR